MFNDIAQGDGLKPTVLSYQVFCDARAYRDLEHSTCEGGTVLRWFDTLCLVSTRAQGRDQIAESCADIDHCRTVRQASGLEQRDDATRVVARILRLHGPISLRVLDAVAVGIVCGQLFFADRITDKTVAAGGTLENREWRIDQVVKALIDRCFAGGAAGVSRSGRNCSVDLGYPHD